MAEFVHGRSFSYRRCRIDDGHSCQVCRAAHNAAVIEANEVRRQRLLEDPTLTKHGVAHTYTNWGCRCRPCTEASVRARSAHRIRTQAQPIGREWLQQ